MLTGYVVAIVFISAIFIKKSVQSYDEYAVANRSLGFLFTFFTYFSTWISGATIVGLAAISFKWGLYQYWFIGISYLMGAVSGPIFLTRIRSLHVHTVGDFFALRFPTNEKLIRVLISISMLSRNITIIGAQFTTIAFFVSIGFNVDFDKTLFFAVLFIIGYTALSGLWGVAGTDILQGMIQIIGLPILFVYIIKSAGGFQEIFDFYKLIDGTSYLNIFANTNKGSEFLLLVLAPGLFFIIEDQTTWQRINSAKNDKVAFWGYLAPIGAALLWALVPCLIGIFSKSIFPNFTAYPIALLDFIFSLPQAATVLVLFAIVSSSIATCDSYLLASGVIFSKDIVLKVFMNKASDENLILATRLGILLTGLLSLYAGMQVYDIFELYMLGAYIGGSILTVPYLLTWFSKRMNGVGLIAGIISSIISFFLCIIVFDFNYSISMIVSMSANVFFSYAFHFLGQPPSKESVAATYYFSHRFSTIRNIPK